MTFDKQIKDFIHQITLEQADIEKRKDLRDEIQFHIGQGEKRIEALRNEIAELMESEGVLKTETEFQTLFFQNSQPKVIIVNEDELSEEFLITTKRPDKVYIKKTLEKGLEVRGAMLSNGGMHLVIKAKQ